MKLFCPFCKNRLNRTLSNRDISVADWVLGICMSCGELVESSVTGMRRPHDEALASANLISIQTMRHIYVDFKEFCERVQAEKTMQERQ